MTKTLEERARREADRIVGYVDRLGHLRCPPCHKADQGIEPDGSGYPAAVNSRSFPHNVESCESCKRPLLDATPPGGSAHEMFERQRQVYVEAERERQRMPRIRDGAED